MTIQPNRWLHALLRSLAFFAMVLTLSAGEPQKVALTNLPVAVQKTIKTQVGADKLGDLEQDDDGDITCTVELTKNGQERTFTVDADGVLVSLKIGLEETPAAVRKTIQTQLGRGELNSVEKTFEAGQVAYDVEMTTTNGASRSFTVALDGILERLQLALEETPAAVRKTIETQTANAKLGDIFRVYQDGELSFEAEFSRGSRDRDLSVSPDGRLLSEQIFLFEIPPLAARTIRERIGDGRILRIDHVFERNLGVFPYEVDGRKDGKPFNFSVGLKGRFLGMDE